MAAVRKKSRKRSSGKANKQRRLKAHAQRQKLPPILLDEDTSAADFASYLRGRGYRVMRFSEQFQSGTKDAIWLKKAGESGWLAISRDHRIRHEAFERMAVQQFRVALVVLRTRASKGVAGWIEMIKKAERRLLNLLRWKRRPYIIHISADGSPHVAWPLPVAKK